LKERAQQLSKGLAVLGSKLSEVRFHAKNPTTTVVAAKIPHLLFKRVFTYFGQQCCRRGVHAWAS
jgi:hypothetical protein